MKILLKDNDGSYIVDYLKKSYYIATEGVALLYGQFAFGYKIKCSQSEYNNLASQLFIEEKVDLLKYKLVE